MSYENAKECTTSNVMEVMKLTIPVLLLTILAGPGAWVWILRRDAARRGHAAAAGGSDAKDKADEEDSSLRFLTGSYQEDFRYWEACRLSKTMALAGISAVAPGTYSPCQKLTLALVVMGLFLLAHSTCNPYSNNMLNRVELLALAVLALGAVGAVFLTGEAWSKTAEMEKAVLLGITFALFVAEAWLVGYFVYAKFLRAEAKDEAAEAAEVEDEEAREEAGEEAGEEEARKDAEVEEGAGTAASASYQEEASHQEEASYQEAGEQHSGHGDTGGSPPLPQGW